MWLQFGAIVDIIGFKDEFMKYYQGLEVLRGIPNRLQKQKNPQAIRTWLHRQYRKHQRDQIILMLWLLIHGVIWLFIHDTNIFVIVSVPLLIPLFRSIQQKRTYQLAEKNLNDYLQWFK